MDKFDKSIIRAIDDKWKWIAREKDGTLSLFVDKPHKTNECWWVQTHETQRINVWCSLGAFTEEVLSFIKWENVEPTSIEALRMKIKTYQCSFCGMLVEPIKVYSRKFCPVCGRRMDIK